MSLRNQFLSLLTALFLAVLSATFLVSVTGTRLYLERQLASHAQDAATALSVGLGQSLGKGDRVLAQAQVASMFDRGYFRSIRVLNLDRSAVVDKTLPPRIEEVPLWFATLFPIDTAVGEAFVGSGWKQLGKVLVESQPTYAYQHLWNTSLEMVVWLMLIGVCALGFAHSVLFYINQPLRAIEKSAKDVQAKRFEQIHIRPWAPELARVVVAMNQMSRRVGEMLDAEMAKVAALHRQAYEDELTGLLNRRGYELQLHRLLEGHRFSRASVVAVELDDMRIYNREHGYAVGEKLLRLVVDAARSASSAVPGAVLARTNEFSFSFLLPEVATDRARQIGSEMRNQVLTHLHDFPDAQSVPIHMGIASFQPADKRSDVFARVDLALESARQSGHYGLHVLDEATDAHGSLGSFGWRTLIQTALHEGRWKVLRQPVVALTAPGVMLQHEYMARLVDANGDLVPAGSFLPMAVRHRLMPDVDRAMVTLVMEQLRHGGDQGLLAVNLSLQSVDQDEFMKWLSQQLRALGPRAPHLTVEVSEFGSLRKLADVMRLRDLVRSHGGQFGIDHFGLETDALELLRVVVPDYVKLTGSLTAEVDSKGFEAAMLQTFVGLAHALDVKVIALQVERASQRDALAALGVDGVQGYYFGAPQ